MKRTKCKHACTCRINASTCWNRNSSVIVYYTVWLSNLRCSSNFLQESLPYLIYVLPQVVWMLLVEVINFAFFHAFNHVKKSLRTNIWNVYISSNVFNIFLKQLNFNISNFSSCYFIHKFLKCDLSVMFIIKLTQYQHFSLFCTYQRRAMMLELPEMHGPLLEQPLVNKAGRVEGI